MAAWTQIGETGGVATHALALHPSSAGHVYAGTYYRGLFITTDDGRSWSSPLQASVGAIAIDTRNAATVYAGTWHDGAHKSLDGGANWALINTGLAANDVYALAVDPQVSQTVYAGTEVGIFKSGNGGTDWQGASSGFTGRNVYALAFADGALFAGTDVGVFKSVNGAVSWAPANAGLSANHGLALATGSGVIYAGTDHGVFRSDNRGVDWVSASTGLPVGAVHALACTAAEPQTVYAGTGEGVYVTEDGGASWAALSEGLADWALQIHALALDAHTSTWNLYAGTGSGVWKRTVRVPTGPTATPTPTGRPTSTMTPERPHRAYLPVAMRQFNPANVTPAPTAADTLTPTRTPRATASPTQTATPTATRTPTQTPTGTVGIHGRVTFGSAAAPNIELELIVYAIRSQSTVATTTTNALGRYRFTGVPGLDTGKTYYVLYDNPADDARYVAFWHGPDITSYAAGQSADGGDFDIANVELLVPDPNASVSLPAEFRWRRREFPGDTYRWRLFDPDNTSTSWQTNDLGDVGSYTLTELPSGATSGKVYGWYVWVYDGADSFGSSYYYRRVTFR
jgi:hypothetical protein